MFEKTATTWGMMKASWNVLKSDKELAIFPLLSGIGVIIVLAFFGSSYWWAHSFWPVEFTQNPPPGYIVIHGRHYYSEKTHLAAPPKFYAALALFYFCNYSVIYFFSSGLVFCALSRMQGGSATFKNGIREASKRIHQIIGWALVVTTVGVLLRMLADRASFFGKIILGLSSIAFSLASFLVVPVMVAENKGPIAALKESSELFTKTWGKQIKGNLGFGAVYAAAISTPNSAYYVPASFARHA